MPASYCFINTPAWFVLKAFGPYFLFNIWAGPSDGKTIEAGPSVGKTYRPNAGKTNVGQGLDRKHETRAEQINLGPIPEIHIQCSRVQAQVSKRK